VVSRRVVRAEIVPSRFPVVAWISVAAQRPVVAAVGVAVKRYGTATTGTATTGTATTGRVKGQIGECVGHGSRIAGILGIGGRRWRTDVPSAVWRVVVARA